MRLLDHRVPPPVIALLCALLAWALARGTPGWTFGLPARIPLVVVLVAAGFALDLAGLAVFRRAKTTLNPLAPARSTAIVRAGPYRFTRNPMYLGMALVLLGVCAYFANALSLAAVALFVAYITRFQIVPEERLLLEKFGEPFAQYMQAVRRWI